MFKDYYKLEPDKSALIHTISGQAKLLKPIFGLLIDAKIIPKRKYYFIIFCFLAFLAQFTVATYWIKDANLVGVVLFIVEFALAYIDATLVSIIV